MAIFRMDNNDWSDNVVASDYNINYIPIYEEWTDGGQVKHKDVIRRKLQGTFKMFFSTDSDLQDFLSACQYCRSAENTYPVELKANNRTIDTLISCDVYMEFAPVRKRDVKEDDAFDIFEVTIEEP